MARITRTDLFDFANFKDGTVAAVGHTRAVAHSFAFPTGAPKITGTLHGHEVFTLEQHPHISVLTVSHAGFQTVTTTAAINDFLKAAGIRMGLSQAGGKLTLTASGERVKQTDMGVLPIALDRDTLRPVMDLEATS